MTDKKIEIDARSYVKIGLPILTILIFFALLGIHNADVRVIDLTVEDILSCLILLILIELALFIIIASIIIIIWIIINS